MSIRKQFKTSDGTLHDAYESAVNYALKYGLEPPVEFRPKTTKTSKTSSENGTA